MVHVKCCKGYPGNFTARVPEGSICYTHDHLSSTTIFLCTHKEMPHNVKGKGTFHITNEEVAISMYVVILMHARSERVNLIHYLMFFLLLCRSHVLRQVHCMLLLSVKALCYYLHVVLSCSSTVDQTGCCFACPTNKPSH